MKRSMKCRCKMQHKSVYFAELKREINEKEVEDKECEIV